MRSLLNLPDGRLLHYEVSGPAGGRPLISHHGTPGALVQRSHLARAAHERGLQLVTFSRPGYGDSTRHPGRSVADVSEDVSALLNALGAETCLTVGASGGGPHALATAARLRERVLGALIVSCPAPWPAVGLEFMAGMGADNVEELTLALQGESVLRPYVQTNAAQLAEANLEDVVASMATLLPPVDRAVLSKELGQDLLAILHEAVRTGVDGWVDDDLALTQSWGFELGEVVVPTTLWHGELDLMAPVEHGRWLAARLPRVSAHLLPGEGHLSVGTGALPKMLDELLELALLPNNQSHH